MAHIISADSSTMYRCLRLPPEHSIRRIWFAFRNRLRSLYSAWDSPDLEWLGARLDADRSSCKYESKKISRRDAEKDNDFVPLIQGNKDLLHPLPTPLPSRERESKFFILT